MRRPLFAAPASECGSELPFALLRSHAGGAELPTEAGRGTLQRAPHGISKVEVCPACSEA